MGAVVSAADERPESVYAKTSFEQYTVQNVYQVCAWCKAVMGPIMRKRWAEGSAVPTSTNADSGSDSDEDEAKSYASGENGDDEVLIDDESSHASCNNDNKPLKSLFGVDLTFSDFFTVFGTGCCDSAAFLTLRFIINHCLVCVCVVCVCRVCWDVWQGREVWLGLQRNSLVSHVRCH